MYKELNDLLLKAKAGDKDSKEEILKRLQGLIIKKIKRYYNKTEDYSDLIQDGNTAILESIDNYDESKGVYFLGYIKTVLKFTYLNKHKERIHLSLNTPVGEDQDEEMINLLESHELDPMEQILKLEEESRIIKALEQLTHRQREVVIAFYIEELSINQIAKRLGITYRTVVNTKTRALERLRGDVGSFIDWKPDNSYVFTCNK